MIGTFKIDDLTVVNPTIEIKQVRDNIIEKTCSVEVIFNVENSIINYSRTLEGFIYLTSWEDTDIIEWVNLELAAMNVNLLGGNARRQASASTVNPIESVESVAVEPTITSSWYTKLFTYIKSLF